MERFAFRSLVQWKDSPRRKPLLLLGARQVGKTWLMKELGAKHFSKTIYLNFEKRPEFKEFFIRSKEPRQILSLLKAQFGEIDGETLIIFDEIQECPEALNSLKYFEEETPEYHIVGAGSLLGLALTEGFPVGKVNFLRIEPLSFFEFLMASGENNLLDYLNGLEELSPIPEIFANSLKEKLKTYLLLGGMPEVIETYLFTQNISEAEDVMDEILLSYQNDFGKHADKIDVEKIKIIYDSLPSQLAKENKKFLYKVAKEGARAREYENALNWLKDADLVKKVVRVEKAVFPLSSYQDVSCFKIYKNDVGLLRRKSRLPAFAINEGNRLYSEFKGSLSENFVLLSLSRQLGDTPHYWNDGVYEVDFLIQTDFGIIPIEVKSGENAKATSLKNYLKRHEEAPLGVRLSLLDLSFDGRILNVPLYLVDRLLDFVSLAIKSKEK